MDVYIDYNNFCSYLESINKEEWNEWIEWNAVLRQYLTFYFNFSEDKLNEDIKIKLSFEGWRRYWFSSGRGKTKFNWNSNFPDRPIEPNIHNSFTPEQLSSIYMLDREGVEGWAEKGVLLVAPVGKELNVIKNLRIDKRFVNSVLFTINKDLKDWSKFGDNSSPCTDIIIADPYIFAQEEESYEKNFLALLVELCQHAEGMPINIVIFTCNWYIDNQIKIYPNFKKIIKQIKDKVQDKVGVKPNVTIVKITGEHDRTIFTNYKFYRSGDSFKYFDAQGKLITKGRGFYINSICDPTNKEFSDDFIKSMQDFINNIDKKWKNCILGDNKSNFLTFPEVSSCGGNIAENVNESEPNISKSS